MSFRTDENKVTTYYPLLKPLTKSLATIKDPRMKELINTYYSDSVTDISTNKIDGGGGKSALIEFNKKHGVCGEDNYVKKSLWNMDPKHTHPCQKCPDVKVIDDIRIFIDPSKTTSGKATAYSTQREIDTSLRSSGHNYTPSNQQLVDMCSYDKYDAQQKPPDAGKAITTWFPSQYNANPYKKHEVGIDWKNPSDNLLEQWITDRINNKELDCLILGSTKQSSCDRKGLRGLDPYKDKHSDFMCLGNQPCRNATDFKKLISEGRGGSLTCAKIMGSPKALKKSKEQHTWEKTHHALEKFNCSNTKSTMKELNYVIPAQYQEWSADFLNQKPVGDSFKGMGKKLLPINAGFERCINDLLIDYGSSNEHDLKMIREIKGKDHITKLSSDHIDFISKKLRMLLIDKTNEDVLSCIRRNMIVDKSICNAGLTEQMWFILNILFSVIGFNFHMEDIYGDAGNKQLMVLIDKLGDIIPKSLETIINISEKLEREQCGNIISDSTKSLKKLHEKLFKDSKNVVNFDLGISKMISDATNQEFNRTTALAFLGIAFLKYF